MMITISYGSPKDENNFDMFLKFLDETLGLLWFFECPPSLIRIFQSYHFFLSENASTRQKSAKNRETKKKNNFDKVWTQNPHSRNLSFTLTISVTKPWWLPTFFLIFYTLSYFCCFSNRRLVFSLDEVYLFYLWLDSTVIMIKKQ